MKVTDEEVRRIKRLSGSNSVTSLSDAVLRSLNEPALSRIIAGFLYLKANARPDKEFIDYLMSKELWDVLPIGLNVMGAVIPAMIFDKEFRMLAMKTGMNKGFEIGAKTAQQKIAQSKR